MFIGKDFVKRIDEVLKRKNLKRQAACNYCGISTQAITDWDKKNRKPSVETVFKLADFLEVSVRYLVTGEEEHGISQDILDMAYEIARLDQNDQREIQLILNLKKEKYLGTEQEKDSSTG